MKLISLGTLIRHFHRPPDWCTNWLSTLDIEPALQIDDAKYWPHDSIERIEEGLRQRAIRRLQSESEEATKRRSET